MNKNRIDSLSQKVKVKLGLYHEIFNHNGRNINAGGVYRLVQIGNSKPYVCLSASRKDLSEKQKDERNKDLLSKIKGKGLYAYQMVGLYKECPNSNPKCKEEDKVLVEEESFFVPYREDIDLNEFVSFFHKLAKEYNQDSILLGLPKTYKYPKDAIMLEGKELPKGQHILLYNNGSFESIGTKVTPQKITDVGSKAIDPKKKDRTMEWVVTGTYQPRNYFGVLGCKNKGIEYIHGVQHENSKWYDSLNNYLKRTPNSIDFIREK